jgi:lysylphosphatidylglycerol synthetase-like protein (DUF2156 family)
MAYSTLQKRLRVFTHPSFEGFMAYTNAWGRAVVLSNPVTLPRDYAKATTLFLEQYPKTAICQATNAYVPTLEGLGFYITGFGVDNVLDMEIFKVSRKVRPNLHRFVTRLRNLNYQVTEEPGDMATLQSINQAWLASKQNKKEFGFLARPFVSNQEPDMRVFLLEKDNAVLGFCTFDPVYAEDHSQRVDSYVLQHLRVKADTPKGSADYLLIQALSQLQAQGVKQVSLGLSLLHQRKHPSLRPHFLVEFLLDLFYNHNDLYKCKTIAEHKDRYHGRKEHTFYATSKRGDVISNFSVIKANGLI